MLKENQDYRKFSFHKKYSHIKQFGKLVEIIKDLRNLRKVVLLPSSLVSSLSLSDLFTTIALELSLEPPTFSPSVMQIKFFPLQLHPQTCISKPIEVFRRTEGSTPQVRVTNLPSSISDILSRSLVSSNTLKCSFFLIKKMERLSPI